MRPDNLGFPTIPKPAIPDKQNNLIELEKWKATNKQYSDLMEKQEENKRQAYAIVWGQCLPTVQDLVKGSDTYATINNNLDLIELLGLIRTSMYTGATSKDSVHLLINTMEWFHTFKQTSRTDNATYWQTFQSHVDAIDHLNGDLGVHIYFIDAFD
jgi:hypothetical protein